MNRLLVIFISLFICLLAPCRASANPSASQMSEVQPPVEIRDVFYFRDGGTIGVVIADAKGKEFKFCLDHRLGTKSPHPIFWGNTRPAVKGTQKLTIGGNEEKMILNLLQEWARKNLSAEEIDKLMAAKSTQGFSTEQFRQYQIVKLIIILKKRQNK